MRLRTANPDDLDFILDLETCPEVQDFIVAERRDQHVKKIVDPDNGYVIFEDDARHGLGYAILCGLTSPHDSIELKRIVMGERDRGLGRVALELVIKLAFDENGANRLWLIVFEDNARALHVYRALGFKDEGVMRESGKRGGKYYGAVVMSMLAAEYAIGAAGD